MANKSNLIQDKSYKFALSIITLYKDLIDKKEFILSKQLLRCGTSIGVNIERAFAALSKKDFISKMSIASKESRETKYWLRLLDGSQFIKIDYKKYLEDITEIINILTAIVKTSQTKLNS